MKEMKQRWRDSLYELKNVRSLVVLAMLLAVAVVLGFYQLQVTDYMRVGFSFLANELAGMIFGPVAGGAMSVAADVLKYVVKHVGAFFPGLTFSSLLGGVIYGMVLYKRPLTLRRVFLANGIVTAVVNLGLNTYWMTVLYGNSFLAIFPARALKEAVLLPVTALLFYTVAKVLARSRAFSGLGSKAR